jgi:branched-chain amino acid aminotransferase
LFAGGTGAIVAPIEAIGEADGQEWSMAEVGRLSSQLRDELLDIQEGKADDPFGWVIDAADTKALAAFINK